MKSLLTIFTVVFTMMFSCISFAEWERIGETTGGNVHYVDFEKLRKHGGYVYYWQLIDFLKSDENGNSSVKGYEQVDCNAFRWKVLSIHIHEKAMGGGTFEAINFDDNSWEYPPPNSISEFRLEQVCSRSSNFQ